MQGSTIIPSVRYRDAHAAIAWLVRVFGMTKQAVYVGKNNLVDHAQLTYGTGMLMLGSVREDGDYHHLMAQPDEVGGKETAGLCLIVKDCDAAWERAKAEGAEVVQELNEPPYGGKAFAVRDPEGHTWWVGSYDPWAGHDAPAAEGTA